MESARAYFKGKKITVLGLGLLGKGLGDTAFLAQCGADVTVTDLKTAEELAPSIQALKKYKNIRYVLGRHDMTDFENCDVVLKAQGVPLDSPYIMRARESKIPVRMDDELFVSFAPKGVKIIGVTGTRGKTTTASLIFHILKKAGKRVHLGGNIRGVATLELLKKVKPGDIVVLELSSWQLQGFGEQKIAPNISVFTNFLSDHMNYYANDRSAYFKDKAFIFKYQKAGDVLVAGNDVSKKIPKSYKGKLIVGSTADIPKSWKLPLPGEHNRENIALAMHACRALKIPLAKIRIEVESFKAVEGRLQLIKNIRGVAIYNDNNSTTPDATIAALRAVGNPDKRNVVLILGGDDKKLDTSKLVKEIPKWCSKVVLFKERGTDTIRESVMAMSDKGIDVYEEEGLSTAVNRAFQVAVRGETILYSPAFSSFGKYFKNEYDRGDQFIQLVKKLK